jgi:hypothetical protein
VIKSPSATRKAMKKSGLRDAVDAPVRPQVRPAHVGSRDPDDGGSQQVAVHQTHRVAANPAATLTPRSAALWRLASCARSHIPGPAAIGE